ncbi:MAG: esterase-like activity of phytase family protein [Bdellovibrionales bacterium]|nr:esterase-like activity of phytase family protein [Bdellovibrionales bacterium]
MKILFLLFLICTSVQAKTKYLGHLILPKEASGLKYKLGGISGWVYEAPYFYAISDSSGKNGPNRIIKMTYQAPLKLNNFEEILLTTDNQDFEGIVLTNDSFILSHEGPDELSLYEVSKKGRLIKKKILPYPMGNIHRNRGLEGLSKYKDNLMAIFENPLKNEWPVNRALFFDIESLELQRNYAYLLDAIPLKYKAPDYGVSEILFLSEKKFLSLERGYDRIKSENWIKLFINEIDKFTTDLELNSPHDISWAPISKRLLLDFDDIRPLLPIELRSLDNFEAMSFGPRIKGKKTIWIAADDNFSDHQQNLVLILTIE